MSYNILRKSKEEKCTLKRKGKMKKKALSFLVLTLVFLFLIPFNVFAKGKTYLSVRLIGIDENGMRRGVNGAKLTAVGVYYVDGVRRLYPISSVQYTSPDQNGEDGFGLIVFNEDGDIHAVSVNFEIPLQNGEVWTESAIYFLEDCPFPQSHYVYWLKPASNNSWYFNQSADRLAEMGR
jgi:hypothetical protein